MVGDGTGQGKQAGGARHLGSRGSMNQEEFRSQQNPTVSFLRRGTMSSSCLHLQGQGPRTK